MECSFINPKLLGVKAIPRGMDKGDPLLHLPVFKLSPSKMPRSLRFALQGWIGEFRCHAAADLLSPLVSLSKRVHLKEPHLVFLKCVL